MTANPSRATLQQVMRAGQRIAATPLADIRSHAAANLARLPEPLRQLQEPCDYPVQIADALRRLTEQVDRDSFVQR